MPAAGVREGLGPAKAEHCRSRELRCSGFPRGLHAQLSLFWVALKWPSHNGMVGSQVWAGPC